MVVTPPFRRALLLLIAAAPTVADVVEPLPAAVTPLTETGDAVKPIEGAGALRVDEVESLAVGASPSIAALQAQVNAARWECVQAGLPPNPTVGYVGSEIGNEGAAGQQGAFVSQQFVRGGKLGYAQAVASKEARRLEQELAVERLRVLTDVRTAFYEVYLSQREVELARGLIDVSGKATETTARLLEAGEGRRTDALQAEIESQRARAAARRAEQRLLANWRRLATLTAMHGSEPVRVWADRGDLLAQMSWDETVDRVLMTSPEVASRVAAIEKARCQIARERAELKPDITAQLSVQYDDATSDTISGVQIGMPLLLWNRNQGGIGRAVAELSAARRRLEATEQTIERRLAEVYGRYEVARTLAEALEEEVLPRAQVNLDLATQGYEAGEIAFLELLTVQRTYFEVNLESLSALRELNGTTQLIRGCLLSDSGLSD